MLYSLEISRVITIAALMSLLLRKMLLIVSHIFFLFIFFLLVHDRMQPGKWHLHVAIIFITRSYGLIASCMCWEDTNAEALISR